MDGRYFDKKNGKKAKRIERKAERKANRLKKRGKSSGDLRERVGELRQSAEDVRDMRGDETTEYRYASKEFKTKWSSNDRDRNK